MTKWITIAALLLVHSVSMAQNVGINETGATPDPSAMLDIVSADKGMLVPRMPDHTVIAAPATGLLVYNTSTNTFWFFDGTIWIEITFPVSELVDNDGDTWVRVEMSPDEDIIRFGAASATSQMHFDGQTLHFTTDNAFVGDQSGSLVTPGVPGPLNGTGNAFFGNFAGAAATTGYWNTLMGHRAGYALTSGIQNSIIGAFAGDALTTGSDNTMLGYLSGSNLTTGYSNTLIGNGSGSATTAGYQNTAVGRLAGQRISTGINNTYLGHEAGANNKTGQANVAIGWLSGSDLNVAGGNENVFVGGMAGRNSYGNANTNVGFKAGKNSRNASSNTFVGHNAGRGFQDVLTNTNQVGSFNAFVGANTGAQCRGCEANVLMGESAGIAITSANQNVMIGRRAGYTIETGIRNVFIGNRAGEYLTDVATSHRLIIANNQLVSDVLVYGEFDNKRVGINTILPTQTFSVNGTAGKPGGGDWLTFSDRRVKKNVAAFTDGLDVLMRLDPVTFQYKQNSGYDDTEKQFVGFIAQDVEVVAPYMITTYDDSDGPSKLADKRVFDESALSKILVNAVQEQQLQIEALNARIKQLEELIMQAAGQPQNASAEK